MNLKIIKIKKYSKFDGGGGHTVGWVTDFGGVFWRLSRIKITILSELIEFKAQ